MRTLHLSMGGGGGAGKSVSGKHFAWHKAWSRDAQGHLLHSSGLRVVVKGRGKLWEVEAVHASLSEFHAFETLRGVPVHQLAERLQRLLKEARLWLERPQ